MTIYKNILFDAVMIQNIIEASRSGRIDVISTHKTLSDNSTAYSKGNT